MFCQERRYRIMKLISLHIENFGILHNFDYSFSDQLNVICEENGTGKTTLGVFIKVMFYGFANEKKRNNLEKERFLYKPWGSDTYGGTIVFEYNQKIYRLSRLFGNKESNDVYQLKDHFTGLDSQDFKGVNIGPELFKVDAASFARTMFISQKPYEFVSFNDIDAKLGMQMDSIEDMSVFENAKKRLEEEISKLSTKKKTGCLDQLNSQIQDLRNEILYKPAVESALEEMENNRVVLNKEIQTKKENVFSLQQELKIISTLKEKMQKKAKYEFLLDAYIKAEEDLQDQRKYFPMEIPNHQLESKILEAQNLSVFLTQQEENRLSDTEKDILSLLSKRYRNVDIYALDIDKTEEYILHDLHNIQYILSHDLTKQEKELLNKESVYFSKNYSDELTKKYIQFWDVERNGCAEAIQKSQLSRTEDEQLDQLEFKFKGKKVDLEYLELLKRDWTGKREDALSQIEDAKLSFSEQNELRKGETFFGDSFDIKSLDTNRKLWEERNEILQEFKQKQEGILPSKIKNEYSLFLIIGLGLLVGIGFLCFVNKLLAIITVIVAIISLGIYFLKFSNKANISNLEKDRIQEIEQQVSSFLESYGYAYEENGVFLYLNDLEQKFVKFLELKKLHQQYQSTIADQKKLVAEIDKNVRDILNFYGYDFIESEVTYSLLDINHQYQTYISLKGRKEQYQNENAFQEERVKQMEATIFSYLQRFGYAKDRTKVSINLYDISYRFKKWSSLKEKWNNEELMYCKNQHSTLSILIQRFFDRCLVKVDSKDYVAKFNSIKEDISQLKSLLKKVQNYETASQKYNALLENIRSYVSSFGFSIQENLLSQLDDIQNHVLMFETSLNNFNITKNNKICFEKEYPDYQEWKDLSDPYEEDALSKINVQLEKERENLDILKEEMLILESRLKELNEQYNDLCDKEGIIQHLMDEQTSLEKRLYLLRNTKMLLEETKKSLDLKYSAPIANALEKYFSILGRNAGFRIEVNIKKELSIVSQGISRDIKYLSEGYKDIVDLCFRLALVDVMYPQEKPLIILDDPFINLDADKIKKGLALLEEVKKEYQILYLTCHESRI